MGDKTDEQANITVAGTPLDLLPRSKEWKFSVTMNTHTINLNQDMTKVAALVDEQGKEYLPTTWAGDKGDGHHRTGFLLFKSTVPTSTTVELKIRDVGQSTVRVFKWHLFLSDDQERLLRARFILLLGRWRELWIARSRNCLFLWPVTVIEPIGIKGGHCAEEFVGSKGTSVKLSIGQAVFSGWFAQLPVCRKSLNL
jgi:hypothetical protein